MRNYKKANLAAQARLDLIVAAIVGAIAIFACVLLFTKYRQTKACTNAGYPRTVNPGLIWPDIRCVRRGPLGNDEIIKL